MIRGQVARRSSCLTLACQRVSGYPALPSPEPGGGHLRFVPAQGAAEGQTPPEGDTWEVDSGRCGDLCQGGGGILGVIEVEMVQHGHHRDQVSLAITGR